MPSKNLSRISYASLADKAREAIRKAILEGTIGPDERFTIDRLAAELGISRTPVREAIKSLEADGILRILPNKGIVVQRFSKEELRERYAVRALLEAYAGKVACMKKGTDLYPLLEKNVAAMEQAMQVWDSADEFQAINSMLGLNREFHLAIVQASGCELVQKILGSLQGPVSYRLHQWRSPERRQAILDHHRRIALAFRANDPEKVQSAIEEHIQDINDFLLATMQDSDGQPPLERG